MKIETKLDIGDKIFYIYEMFKGAWRVSSIVEVSYIKIFEKDKLIYAVFEKDFLPIIFVDEQNCFLTKEEAQAEADRRNNGK